MPARDWHAENPAAGKAPSSPPGSNTKESGLSGIMRTITPPDKSVIRHSFASRMSMYILCVCALTFMVAASIFQVTAQRIVKQEASRHAQSELFNVVGFIDDLLLQVQTTTSNMEWAVREKLGTPDELIELNCQMIRNSKYIVGSSIALTPDYYPEKGTMFAPYAVRKEDGSIEHKNLGTVDYDYLAQPWYTEAAESGEARWSAPYFDKGGADDIISTYSYPIKDKNGKVIAILTADISLKDLADKVLALHPYPNAYCFLLDCKGHYVVHHKRDRILYQDIQTATSYMKDRSVEKLIEGMLSQQSGMVKIMDGENPCYVFYTSISTSGWPIALVCPKDEVYAVIDELTLIIVSVFVFGGLFLLVMCRWIIRRICSPLKQFSQAATQVAHGQLDAALPEIESGDELAYFRDTFEYMQHSLRKYIEELQLTTSIKNRMEGELQVARRIQMGMIPKVFPPYPERAQLDLYALLAPAREVGGDLYDFFIINNKLYIIVGDVSGKGVPASLVMAITCRLIRLIAAQTDSPAQMMKALNDSISEDNNTNMFVTMYIGVLDLATGHFRYCNAGHNPPILAIPDGEAHFYEVKPNIPIGVMPDFEFAEQSMQLPDHGTIFLYTDGVNEAEDKNRELFGNKRMLSVVRQHSCESARNIVEHMLKEVNHFATDTAQSDDITMLCLRYHQAEADKQAALEPQTLTIRNKMEQMEQLPDFLENYCRQLPIPGSLILSLNLAIEEAMVNCVQYAYAAGEEGDISLRMQWDNASHELSFELRDKGVPFDPTAAPDPDTALSAEERPIGGLGILLVRKLMDSVSYSRQGEHNVLIMRKKIYAHSTSTL